MENTNNSQKPIGVKIDGYAFYVPYQLNEIVANGSKITMEVGSMKVSTELLLGDVEKTPIRNMEDNLDNNVFMDIHFVPDIPQQEKIESNSKEEASKQEEIKTSEQEQAIEEAEALRKQQMETAEQERILTQQRQDSEADKLPGEDDSII